jgi:hypothetical protein
VDINDSDSCFLTNNSSFNSDTPLLTNSLLLDDEDDTNYGIQNDTSFDWAVLNPYFSNTSLFTSVEDFSAALVNIFQLNVLSPQHCRAVDRFLICRTIDVYMKSFASSSCEFLHDGSSLIPERRREFVLGNAVIVDKLKLISELSESECHRAAIASNNESAEAALDWHYSCLNHDGTAWNNDGGIMQIINSLDNISNHGRYVRSNNSTTTFIGYYLLPIF